MGDEGLKDERGAASDDRGAASDERERPAAPEAPAAPDDAPVEWAPRAQPAAPSYHSDTYVPRPQVPGQSGGRGGDRPYAPAPPTTGSGIPPGGSFRPSARPPAASLASLRGEPVALPAWGWRAALAGLAMAFAPEALLYAVALAGGASETTITVSVGSAIVLVISSFVLYGWQLLAAWLFSLRRVAAGLTAWGFRKPTKAFFWTIPVALAAVYGVSILHDVVVNPQPQDITSEFPHSAGGIVLFVVLAVLMAPIFEETFFRGFLFRGFADSWGWVWGALASGAIFGLAHLQLDVFLPLAALGFALAWVYKRTGSIWTSIALHALFNAISVLAWALSG